MQVGGMDCPSCEMKIETALQKLVGVAEVSVDVATERMTVSYDPVQINEKAIAARVISLGYTIVTTKPNYAQDNNDHEHGPVHSHSHAGRSHEAHNQDDAGHDHSHGDGKFDLKREGLLIGAVVVLFVLGSIFEETLHSTPFSIAEYAVFISAYLLSGWGVLTSAGRNILKGQVFDLAWCKTEFSGTTSNSSVSSQNSEFVRACYCLRWTDTTSITLQTTTTLFSAL